MLVTKEEFMKLFDYSEISIVEGLIKQKEIAQDDNKMINFSDITNKNFLYKKIDFLLLYRSRILMSE